MSVVHNTTPTCQTVKLVTTTAAVKKKMARKIFK
jgi:hypothetical protein